MKMDFNRIQQIVNETVYKYGKMQVNESFMGEETYGHISTAEPVEGHKAYEIAKDVLLQLKDLEGVEDVEIADRLTTMQNRDVDEIRLFVQMQYDSEQKVGSDIKEIQEIADFLRSKYGNDIEIHTGQGYEKTLINFPYRYESEDGEKDAEVVIELTTNADFEEGFSRQSMTSKFDTRDRKLLIKTIWKSEKCERTGHEDDVYPSGNAKGVWSNDIVHGLISGYRPFEGKKDQGFRSSARLTNPDGTPMKFGRYSGMIDIMPVLGKQNRFGKEVEGPMGFRASMRKIFGDLATDTTVNSVENIVKFIHSEKFPFSEDKQLLKDIKDRYEYELERTYGLEGSQETIDNFEKLWNEAEQGEALMEMKNLWGRMLLY